MTKHSYSSLSTLAQCEAKYAYRYLRNLTPVQEDSAAQLAGGWMHAVLAADAIRRGHEASSLLVLPKDLRAGGLRVGVVQRGDDLLLVPPSTPAGLETQPCSAEGMLELLAAYWHIVAPAEERLSEALEDLLGGWPPAAAAELWIRYTKRWGTRDALEEPLLVETWWEREIPGTSHRLFGRMDEITRDTRGLTIVRDHKWSGGWHDDRDDMLDLNAYQLHLTAWGVSEQLRAHGLQRASAVEYNRALFARPSTPQLTKGTQNKDGSWKTPPRLSKATTKYDLWTYLRFCESEEALAAGYAPEQSELDRTQLIAEGDDFFRRNLFPANANVVQRHVRAAAAQANRADVLHPDSAMPSPGPSCNWCEYRALCRTESWGGWPEPMDPRDYGLRLKTPR